MDELQNVVVEQFLELLPCLLYTVGEAFWTLLCMSDGFLDVLSLSQILEADLRNIGVFQFIEVLWIESEECAEEVFGPFNTVQGLFWEHLQSAMWNRIVFFRILF